MVKVQVTHLGLDYGKVVVHNDDGGEVQEYEVPLGLAKAIANGEIVKGVFGELQ